MDAKQLYTFLGLGAYFQLTIHERINMRQNRNGLNILTACFPPASRVTGFTLNPVFWIILTSTTAFTTLLASITQSTLFQNNPIL